MSNPYGVWGRHTESHTSPEISWSRCDGCNRLACWEDEKSKLHPYRYYCEAGSRNLTRKEIYTMGKDECPIGREPGNKRRFR